MFISLCWLGYDHYRPWVNFHSEALACAGVILLVCSQLLTFGSPLFWPCIGRWILLASCVPCMFWLLGIGLFVGDAVLASMYLVLLAGAVFTGFNWGRQPKETLRHCPIVSVMLAISIAAILSAAIGLLQWLAMTEPLGMYVVQGDPGDRAMGNLGQPNQLGTLLLMGLAALVFLFESRAIARFSFALSTGFLTASLVLTQSRSAMVGVVLVTAFLLIKMPAMTKLKRGAVVIWTTAFVASTAMLPSISEFLLLGEGRNIASLTHTSDRITIWRQVLVGIAQAPWLGYGWNQTPTAHAFGALSIPGTMTYAYAHSLVLDLMAWNGIPLGVFWVVLVGYWFSSRLYLVKTPAAITAMAGLLPLAVHSLLEYPFAYAYFLVTAGLLIGIVEASHPTTRTDNLERRWAWPLVVSSAAVGAWISYEYLLVEQDFRIVRFENLRIGNTPEDYLPPTIHLLSHMGEMLQASRTRPVPGMSEPQINRLRQVALRFPYGALHLRYASALALNGDPAGALRQMQVVKGMFGDGYYAAAKYELLELRKHHGVTDPFALP
jgi:O-antigen ligase